MVEKGQFRGKASCKVRVTVIQDLYQPFEHMTTGDKAVHILSLCLGGCAGFTMGSSQIVSPSKNSLATLHLHR